MKKILIVGAGMLQTYVIKRAVEMGYITGAVDKSEDAEGFEFCDFHKAIDIIDMEAVCKYAREMKIDGIMTAATDYGVLTVSYVAEQLSLPGLSLDAAKTVKNKYMVHKVLQKKGISKDDRSFEVTGEDELEEIIDQVVFPSIVKPCDSSGSRGINRIDKKETLSGAIKEAMSCSLTSKVLIERFYEGEEYGVESFVCQGIVNVLAVMKKRMTLPPYYAELGHSTPTGLSNEVEKRFVQLATEIIKAIGIDNSSVNMDFILDSNNIPHMVDIGARMGGNLIGSHIVPYSTGIDYMGNMIKCAVGDFAAVDFTAKKHEQITTGILNLKPGARVIKIPDEREIYSEFSNVRYIKFHLKQDEIIPIYKTNLDGSGYVIIEGEDINENVKTVENVKQFIDNKYLR